jgi:hypothetical protein
MSSALFLISTPQCIAPVDVAGGQAGQAGAEGSADSGSSSGDNSQGSGEDMSDIAQATQDANFIISLEEITSEKDFRAFEILSQWQKGEKDLRNTMIELKNIA